MFYYMTGGNSTITQFVDNVVVTQRNLYSKGSNMYMDVNITVFGNTKIQDKDKEVIDKNE